MNGKQQKYLGVMIMIRNATLEDLKDIMEIIKSAPEKVDCHDIKVYKRSEKLTVFLHCEVDGSLDTDKIELITKDIINRIKREKPDIEDINMHVEPIDALK